MAGVDIGGDGSVQWHAWGDNIKPGKEVVQNHGPHGREHQNVDKTDPGGVFTISIEVPPNQTDANTFLQSFAAACAQAQNAAPGDRIQFILPIVDYDTTQIHVDWVSSPAPPHVELPKFPGASKAG
jgi:hypothetical protein